MASFETGRIIEAIAGLTIGTADRLRFRSIPTSEKEDFRNAQATLAHAKNIIFLGFGYHERTLSALLTQCDLQNKQVFGTARGLPDDCKDQTTLFFNSRIHFGESCTIKSIFFCKITFN